MAIRATIERWRNSETVRLGLFGLGILLMVISPLVGVLPGPGFLVVFPVGLALTLKNSSWAKRRYVAFKRRWPKHGAWADWGLRRASYKRRQEREKRGDAAAPTNDRKSNGGD